MGSADYIEDKIYELSFIIAVGIIEYLLRLYLPEPYVNIGTVVSLVILFLIGTYILIPSIKFEFYPKTDEVLYRNSVDSRSINLDLNITASFKTWVSRRVMSSLCSKYRRDKSFQIYWSPKDAIEVVSNEDYPTLFDEGDSLRIQLFDKVDSESFTWKYKYSLKIAAGNAPECVESTLKLRKSYKSNVRIWHKFLFFLLRTKFDEKIIGFR